MKDIKYYQKFDIAMLANKIIKPVLLVVRGLPWFAKKEEILAHNFKGEDKLWCELVLEKKEPKE